ncbi:MAG TPA: hypothetical protein DHV96_07170 [Lachnospiraceae bacterium]|nr:hypothetical protein [Lachnospiraceae bacterium]
MKKITRIVSLILLCCVVFIPAISAKAATQPVQPSGLGFYTQSKSGVVIDFAFDPNLAYYSPENPYSFGYEVTLCNLKGKVISVLDSTNNSDLFKIEDSNTIAVVLFGNKYLKQPFTFKVRSYVCDQNYQRVYSEYSKEKVVVTRARLYKLKALSKSSGRIMWKKVKGAKKYSIYLSSNNGKKYKKYGSTKSNSMVVNNMTLSKDYRAYVVPEGIKYKKKKVKACKPKEKQAGAATLRIYVRYQ